MSVLQPGVVFSTDPPVPQPTELPTAVPLFVGYTELGEKGQIYRIGTFADYQKQLVGDKPPQRSGLAAYCVLDDTVRHYFDIGGGQCYVLSVGKYESLASVSSADIIAKEFENIPFDAVFAQAPEITLLAIPDIVLLSCDLAHAKSSSTLSDDIDPKVQYWVRVWKVMLGAHQHQRGVFALLDTPADPAVARQCLNEIQNGGLGDALAHGAAYWPHLITDYEKPALAVADSDPQWITVPPSGAIAAAIQRTDHERGVWKAPANVVLTHVVRPMYDYRQADVLFDPKGASANLIRSFPGRGIRVWGCRTLLPYASAWRYVQVRRTLSYIETNLIEMGRFVVFEPNNEITWFKFKARAYAWLRQLWLKGGLAGTQESDAFQLLLGVGESMTADDVLNGRLILKIHVAAYYPAEFIELRLQFQAAETHSAVLEAASSNKSVLL